MGAQDPSAERIQLCRCLPLLPEEADGGAPGSLGAEQKLWSRGWGGASDLNLGGWAEWACVNDEKEASQRQGRQNEDPERGSGICRSLLRLGN